MFAEKLLASVAKTDMIAAANSRSDTEDLLFEQLVPVGMLNGAMSIQKPQAVITDLGKSLLQAAKTGNTEKVHELMSRGAPFTADWLGTSPLHLAARYNHVETCKVLLRAGISKDSKTKVDRTPLHFAAFQGNVDIVELLLNAKCEVDAKDMLKMTALHWAVEKRHDKIVERLLQHGADPNAVSKFGKSPISIATEAGQVDLVRILLLANQMRAASQEQVQEATDSLMYELQQHKERDSSTSNLVDDTEDNITMDLSNDGSISNISNRNSTSASAAAAATAAVTTTIDVDEHDGNSNDTDNLIEKEDSLSDAIINLEQNTEQDPNNLDSNTLQMLKEHGIAMIPSDDSGSSLITSAIQSGRKIVLSEAGKFALNETRMQTATTPPTTKKTIKIIKKTSPYMVSQQQQQQHRQSMIHGGGGGGGGSGGGGGTIKTNKVIKILSAEEFKQICGGEVSGLKKIASSDYRKAVQGSTTMRVPHGVHRAPGSLGSPSGGPTKQFKKIVTTKYRLPGSSLGGSSSNSSSSFSSNNRHIITSADGVKRLRTATGMEIISKLPTKIPQDTVVSVEGAKQASGIVPISTVSSTGGQQQRLVSSNSNLSSNSALGSSAASSMTLGELERHFLELKKQTDDLRKQFELSQKQNEEYRARVDKLEKEVQTLKQSSSNNPNNFIEIV